MSEKKEIEIKIEIPESEYKRLISVFANEGEECENLSQHDIYFAPSNEDYMLEQYPYKWLSIRKRGEKNRLCFKHFYPEKAEKHNYCDEYEVEVQDIDTMSKILNELQFSVVADVNKHRISYKYNAKYLVSFDKVSDLGYFMEIELISKDGDYIIEKENMLKIIQNLSIKNYRIDLRGYPFLIYQKNKKNGA